MKEELQYLATVVYGDDARARISRGNVYVNNFTQGEVLVVRGQNAEASMRMAIAALRAEAEVEWAKQVQEPNPQPEYHTWG